MERERADGPGPADHDLTALLDDQETVVVIAAVSACSTEVPAPVLQVAVGAGAGSADPGAAPDPVTLPSRLLLALTSHRLMVLHDRRWRGPTLVTSIDRTQIERATLRRTIGLRAQHELVIRFRCDERFVASVGESDAENAAELALRIS
ncbi:MAG: hypothetical protein KDB21_12055 [Acidimicrobiales bacterium]|nr:hypothetical protein [Acidimicrobiales bacterium]